MIRPWLSKSYQVMQQRRAALGPEKGTMGELLVENSQLREQIEVLEALTHTQSHRTSPELTCRIRQFETRIQLLTDTPLPATTGLLGGLQQTTLLKGYILELSRMLNLARSKEGHFRKKASRLRDKLQQALATEEHNRQVYRRRIGEYEALLSRLYANLEERSQLTLPETLQREVGEVVRQYESRLRQMGQTLLSLQREKEQLERARAEEERVRAEQQRVKASGKASLESSFEEESERYKEIISTLSQQLNQLQTHNLALKAEGLAMREDEIAERNRLVEEMAAEIRRQSGVIDELKEREGQMGEVLTQYQQEVAALKGQVQAGEEVRLRVRRENDVESASLKRRIRFLEEQAKAQGAEETQGEVENLRAELVAREVQVAFCRAEIERLTKFSSPSQTMASQERQEWQGRVAEAECQASTLKKAFTSTELGLRREIDRLTRQTRSLGQQLHSKHSEMMEYYNQLNGHIIREGEMTERLQQMEEELLRLKEQTRWGEGEGVISGQVIALRTVNFSLREEVKEKEVEIEELKQQVYQASLQHHKSGSLSRLRDEEEELKTLRGQLATTSQQFHQLQQQHAELERLYNEDTDRYRQALLQLEARQQELTYSLQLTTTDKRITERRITEKRLEEEVNREEVWTEEGSQGAVGKEPSIGSEVRVVSGGLRTVVVESRVSIAESESPLGRRSSIKVKKIK